MTSRSPNPNGPSSREARKPRFLRSIVTRSFVAIAIGFIVGVPAAPAAPARPNILWITAEDMSPNLGCYGDPYARTPNLDAFAARAVRYTRAFATAPVCSPSRSCLITGMHATSLGTQRLRSQFPVPRHVRGFTAWLREAGYYCANNVKTDYNLRDEAAFIREAWDESSPKAHWRGRKPGQPFFAVMNLMTTHQSRTSAWTHEEFEKEVGAKLPAHERHDPSRANLPPFHPDTAEARRAWARYHDCVTLMDREAGDILRQLDADGLAGDTIVFFYSDHGMGMPRGKRTLYDSGLRVPLMVRVPEKFRALAPAADGATIDRLVSFVDFAPTVLSLAGAKPPKHFQGTAFLGAKAGRPREYVFGARDRVDEAFDVSRSAHDGRWLYIRNFMPHLPWMQPEAYSDTSTFRQELRQLAATGKLPPGPRAYAEPRAIEELYDTQNDPHQLHNLAAAPAQGRTLVRLRRALREWQLDTHDAGFLTEPQMWARIGTNSTPRHIAADTKRYPLRRLLDAADAVGRTDRVAQQIRWLADADDGVRYWAATGLRAVGNRDGRIREALATALNDPSPVVRIEAAGALAASDSDAAALGILETALNHSLPEVVLHAARTLELLGDKARPALPALRDTLDRARQNEKSGDAWMFIRFSTEASTRALATARRQ